MEIDVNSLSQKAKCFTFVVYIHDIVLSDIGSHQIMVTKYSFLASSGPFQVGEFIADCSISPQELLLHFEDFNSMGRRQDAEVIDLDTIVAARTLPLEQQYHTSPIQHLRQNPQGELTRY